MTRLNIGAGEIPLDGYTPIDRKTGGEAYPLAYEDDSVEAVRASHVLEHFSHREIEAVLAEWVRVVKPGGEVKIAVPDFDVCVEAKRRGLGWPIHAYLMGGHVDDDDVHGAIFDANTLRAVMRRAGVRHIRRWRSEIPDCASLPVSLNLCGVKRGPVDCGDTVAMMTTPRIGPLVMFQLACRIFPPMGVEMVCAGGVYWYKSVTTLLQTAIDRGFPYALFLDYDTVFDAAAVEDLRWLMDQQPDADAICAVQMQRGCNKVLGSPIGPDGKYRPAASAAEFDGELTQLYSAHFGLTLIRTERLHKLARPWFMPMPDVEGGWDNDKGAIDPDVYFWRRFVDAGLKLYQANHVAVGHEQDMITWPDPNFHAIHQYANDYAKLGRPANARE